MALCFVRLDRYADHHARAVDLAKALFAMDAALCGFAALCVFYEEQREGARRPIAGRWARFVGAALRGASIVAYLNGSRFGYPKYCHRWDQFHSPGAGVESGHMKLTKGAERVGRFEAWKRMRDERCAKYRFVAYGIVAAGLAAFVFVCFVCWRIAPGGAVPRPDFHRPPGTALTCYYSSFMLLSAPLTRLKREREIEAPPVPSGGAQPVHLDDVLLERRQAHGADGRLTRVLLLPALSLLGEAGAIDVAPRLRGGTRRERRARRAAGLSGSPPADLDPQSP